MSEPTGSSMSGRGSITSLNLSFELQAQGYLAGPGYQERIGPFVGRQALAAESMRTKKDCAVMGTDHTIHFQKT